MKHLSLKFLQFAWVAETIAILIFTMAASIFLSEDRITLWHQFVPIFGTLIGAQGAASWAGPLLSDKIKADKDTKAS